MFFRKTTLFINSSAATGFTVNKGKTVVTQGIRRYSIGTEETAQHIRK